MMEKHLRKGLAKRLAAVGLAAALTVGLLPAGLPVMAAAAQQPDSSDGWVQGYLDQLVDWGIMRGDLEGNLAPDREISRAEYITMINRAYGYDQPGTTPFEDVQPSDWYYDDTGIAYEAGYFTGTSDKTASPTSLLTREEAAVILGRNLMLQDSVGEDMTFTDSRDMSDWSRGIIKSAAAMGIVKGYPDGSFQPKRNITRGEVASLLVNAIGTPIRESGDYSLGGVYGNVTISASGVTLRDTTIAGDLYISSGVGLGYVTLENVKVLGRIVASGAGESNKGENSILLRNVEAKEMVVDSPANQFVSIRAEGDTAIDTTSVRTPAYLEDASPKGLGLKYIELNGEDGTTLELAGNIGEVMNLTPHSSLVIAQGGAEQVTIDERAVGAEMSVQQGAAVGTLNLDVAANVSGQGDIGTLNVNANGSNVTILPDKIVVRPGVSANVAGETMDTVTAAEASEDPRLLSGYPDARDIAPTTATGAFAANKKGTVYWAVSAVSDGSVGEEDLLHPPAYNAKILANGTLQAGTANTEVTSKISRLTSDGSYYLSAVLVDVRGERSPVKVNSFSTPDDTVPGFASGYPVMSKVTNHSAQVSVMPTKSCQLYYALLPKGSAAPKPADFKANAVTGNLGYGSMDVKKNTVSVFDANSQTLKELETYDLYLWLTDFDGVKSSAVKKLTFTTVDGTPPEFLTEPTVTSIKETSVGLTAALNEVGTIYWALVKQGEEYPKPQAGQTEKPALTSDTAKLQVANGMNALKSGKVSAGANKDVTINVSGLTAQTAYDLYYLAQDKAGNYSVTVKMTTIHTLDTVPPTITQTFTKTNDAEGKDPLPDTDVQITFSEGIQDLGGDVFMEFYQKSTDTGSTPSERKAAGDRLAELLRNDIQLWDASAYPETQVQERTAANEKDITGDWIDYRNLEMKMDDGKTVMTFRSGKNIQLKSGSTYYFKIANIADTSSNKNIIKPNPQSLDKFTTVFAQVNLVDKGVNQGPIQHDATDKKTEARVDMSFQMHPVSTGNVDPSIYYDVFLWSDSIIKYDLYVRITDSKPDSKVENVTLKDEMMKNSGAAVDANGWLYLGNDYLTPDSSSGQFVGKSVHNLIGPTRGTSFPRLNSMHEDWTYEYAVSLTQVGTLTDPETWSDRVTMKVTVPAGPEGNVRNLSSRVDEETWKSYLGLGLTSGGVKAVGTPEDFSVFKQFTDTQMPKLAAGYPRFDAGDTFVNMTLQLDRPGTVYYAVSPVEQVGTDWQCALTTLDDQDKLVPPKVVPTGGTDKTPNPKLNKPVNLEIYTPDFSSDRIKHGNKAIQNGESAIRVDELEPLTTYYVHMVFKGNSQTLSDVYLFQFTTVDVTNPAITLTNISPKVSFKTSTDADLDYALIAYKEVPAFLKAPFDGYAVDQFSTDFIPTKEDKAQDGVDTDFSILDALLTSARGTSKSSYSVFDVFAKQEGDSDIRASVAEYIRSSTSQAGAPPVDQGGFQGMRQNIAQENDFGAKMTTGTLYYCLAVAHNIKGTVDSFRAVKNIQKPDGAAPEFKSVSTYITDYFDLAGKPATPDITDPNFKPAQFTYSGTLTIVFDKPIYFVDQNDPNRIAKPVLISKYNDTTDTDTAVYFHNHVAASPKLPAGSATTNASSTLVINFEKVGVGGTLNIFKDGLISNAGSYTTPKSLQLTFKGDAMQSETTTTPPSVDILKGPAYVYSWG